MKMIPQRFSRKHLIIASVLCVFLLITTVTLRQNSRQPSSIPHPLTPPPPPQTEAVPKRPQFELGGCLPEIEFLRRPELGLTANIQYSRRRIRPIYGISNRDKVTNLSEPLLTQETTINLESCAGTQLPPGELLPLDVPYPYPKKQYPHLLFGLASKYDRINASLPTIAHWLAGTGAQLIGIVVDIEDKDGTLKLKALEAEYAAWNVTATFVAPRMKRLIPNYKDEDQESYRPVPVDHHHFMLIRDMLEHRTPYTQWLGILDDDTFFPSLYPLDEELGKYDYKKPQWLGALSDDFNHVKIWGFMAFGGAGVFLSIPLAQEIEPLLEECIAKASVNTGDGILRDCMFMNSRTRLTIVPGLNQHDLLGDVSGFFESGIRPLSIHHWKSWYQEPILAQATVTSVCGECYLQRWRFGNDTLFANGYSITMYHDGLNSVNLDRIEGTWEHPGPEYDFSYGPLRPKLVGDKKKSYRLKDTEITHSGAIRQIYVHKILEGETAMDGVIELLWER
jgi:hypothetical protein